MTIAVYELEKWEFAYLKEKLPDHTLTSSEERLDPEKNIQENAEILIIFINSPIDETVLKKLPNLKFIATASTGFDHIDLKATKEHNIVVSNVPFYGENTVAEHAMALMLAFSRQIVDSVERTRRGDFSYEGLRGFDLKGKTLGVVGFGHIGQHVARMAKGFEMHVLAYDVVHQQRIAERLKVRYVDLDELLAKSDIITLHAPYNKHTHHMINTENIKKIKKGALLINTARGGLIDTSALFWALENGKLSGAGLDVLEEEVVIKEEKELLSRAYSKDKLLTALENHVLLHHPKVLLTPHNAFNSKEALTRILDNTIENIQGFIKGKPVNVVEG